VNTAPTSPAANTGGGLGAYNITVARNPAVQRGGSGIVIVSYVSTSQSATGGTVTSTGSGASTRWFHTFTSSGTFTLSSASDTSGGSGGSGIVVLRYPSTTPIATGGTITSYINSGTVYQVHTFLTSGTLTLPVEPWTVHTFSGNGTLGPITCKQLQNSLLFGQPPAQPSIVSRSLRFRP
jgi:hypothetical protein